MILKCLLCNDQLFNNYILLKQHCKCFKTSITSDRGNINIITKNIYLYKSKYQLCVFIDLKNKQYTYDVSDENYRNHLRDEFDIKNYNNLYKLIKLKLLI